MGLPARKVKFANLRRNRKTTVSLDSEKRVVAEFDRDKWEWRLRIESDAAAKIDHEHLTCNDKPA